MAANAIIIIPPHAISPHGDTLRQQYSAGTLMLLLAQPNVVQSHSILGRVQNINASTVDRSTVARLSLQIHRRHARCC
jgi:hypothetical protein